MKKRVFMLFIALLLISVSLTGCLFGTSGGQGNSSKTSDGRPTGKRVEANVDEVKQTLENAKAGDHVLLGSWEQDNKTGNGAEAISWTILDQQVGKALVVSDKILEYRYFKEPQEGEDYRWVSSLYGESDIRTFLNDIFYQNAFTDAERALIMTTDISTLYTEDYQQKSAVTRDSVFLLSINEVNRFLTKRGTAVYGIPTDFVLQYDPYMSEVSNVPGIEKAMTWFLRDQGDGPTYAADVAGYTDVPSSIGSNVANRHGIRPAMWIVYNESDMNAYAKGEIEPKESSELNDAIASWKVGDTVQLGRYDINAWNPDGYEDMEWTVIDETDDALLLFMNYAFSSAPMLKLEEDDSAPETLTWAESTLRATLNGDEFLDSMFTPQEKAKLKLTHLSTVGDESWDREGGAETDDLFFVPDRADIEKYFPEKEDQASPNGGYWLRSPSFVDIHMGYVYDGGGFGSKEATEYCGIRPMVWVKK